MGMVEVIIVMTRLGLGHIKTDQVPISRLLIRKKLKTLQGLLIYDRVVSEQLMKVRNINVTIIIIIVFSEGGRYTGFGYSVDPQPKENTNEVLDQALTSLTKGWSMFSLVRAVASFYLPIMRNVYYN